MVEGLVGIKTCASFVGKRITQKRTCGYKGRWGVQKLALSFVFNLWQTPHGKINRFRSNVFFQYSLKSKENLRIFWWIHNILKGDIGKKWVSSNNNWTKASKCSKLVKPKSSNSGLLHFNKIICYWFYIVNTLHFSHLQFSKNSRKDEKVFLI